MSHSNISGFSSPMQSHLVVWYAFPSKKAFWTLTVIPKHDFMSSGVLYPFNALNCFLKFMRHTVTISTSQLCVNKKIVWGCFRLLLDLHRKFHISYLGFLYNFCKSIKLKTKSESFAEKNVTVWHAHFLIVLGYCSIS